MSDYIQQYEIDKQAALLVYHYRMKFCTNENVIDAINSSENPNLLIQKIKHHAGSCVFIPAISQL